MSFVLGFFLISVLSAFMHMAFGANSTPAMRILAMLQDVLVFILPAIATAMIVCRQPARLLCVDSKPKAMPLVLAICTLVCSIPAMDAVIWLNSQLPLPQGIEHSLKEMEAAAAHMVEVLQGPRTAANLLMSILIVGIFAGFSEELLFRGALQRLLTTGGTKPHAAIWASAILFSLMHMQVYGFVPRMLLGAFFGYALYWTGSIWVPVILHMLNNSIYLCAQWMLGTDTAAETTDYSSPGTLLLIVASVVLTAMGLRLTAVAARKNTSLSE